MDTEEAVAEWNMLKSLLYRRYKDVRSLLWPDVWQCYGDDGSYSNILLIIDLIRTLPASSAENERGFSLMKLVKTDRRSRMNNATLNDLMTIQLESGSVLNFDPDPAINQWMNGGKRKRRPGFKDNEPKVKKARLQKFDVADKENVGIEDSDNEQQNAN